MKDRKVLITTIAIVVLAAVAVGAFMVTRSDSHDNGEDVIYYCPMHPTVTSDKPGNCPICGMKLVIRRNVDPAANAAAGSGAIAPSLSTVSLSPSQRVMANVQTTPAVSMPIERNITATGRVTFDETRASQITAYVAGRIERLYINFTGDTVSKGAPVAAVYSPELFSTQQEYLLSIQNRERMRNAGFAGARTAADDLVESTQRRLSLFGMTSSQIRQVARTGKPLFTTTIVSSVSGVVLQKLVVEQQYVALGQPLFSVADLSTVWIEADVPENELGSVQTGQTASITSPAFAGQEFRGAVTFIQPVLAGETRTGKVRIEMPNSNLRFKPDMFVNVRLASGLGRSTLSVPRSAIVDRGQEQFVWVEMSAGNYAPRRVRLGVKSDERVEIVAGLSEGEKVVVNGGFLLDSESQLRAATQGSALPDSAAPTPLTTTHQNH